MKSPRSLPVALAALALTVATCGGNAATANRSATPSAAAPARSPAALASPSASGAAPAVTVKEIAHLSGELPGPISRNAPDTVRVDLETKEVVATLGDGQTYRYWTFGGTVPGPFIRVRVGDTVELHLKNSAESAWPHSIDLHAVTGPGGGSGATQTAAGATSMFHFKALNPGLYVYHCASAPIPMHITNGMYGLILVEPAGGLPKVDREFYVMQGELYTNAVFGAPGLHTFNQQKMDDERPDYVLFNGRVGALTGETALKASVGEKIRIFFGVGGFLPSSFHIIGEILDRVYPEGAMGSEPLQNVQTTLVPAGGAAIVELTLQVPGTYLLVDHTLPRALDKGAAGQLVVTGAANPSIFDGPTGGSGH